jgi:hypothetical protein
VYFVAIWFILWLFGILFPVLEGCPKKNLAILALIWPTDLNDQGNQFLSIGPNFETKKIGEFLAA